MKPIIALNLKTYSRATGDMAREFYEAINEVEMMHEVRVIAAPQAVDIRIASSKCQDVFAQHCDATEQGAFTGAITPEALKDAGCKGSLLNHSEKRIGLEAIAKTILRLSSVGLEQLVCAKDAEESRAIAMLHPTFIAVEPPELIGSGISVSKAKPEVVTDTVKAVQTVSDVPVLCGAGVSTPEDVKKAMALGVCGVLLASAFTKAPDPKELLLKMAEAMK
ncbi:MAG: triose-phosphate isomerase [Candidatus Micrarchaeota archaeon]